MLGIVGALLGAGAHESPALPAPPAANVPDGVIADIRLARVDLYCANDERAVADIRSARRQLGGRGAAHHPRVLKALDEAAWQVRQHHGRAAQDALEDALRHVRCSAR
jgi:hypothetical protein